MVSLVVSRDAALGRGPSRVRATGSRRGCPRSLWNHETETRFVSIKKVWATTLRRTGIANFRFHDLRHRFASYVHMGLDDLRATQVLLGHADPRMTQRYAHLSGERLREAVRALSWLPRSGIRSGTGQASG